MQPARRVTSFSSSCRPGWLSLPHILKIACMTRTHWPYQHFGLLSIILLQGVEWSKQKFVSPTGLWTGYAPATRIKCHLIHVCWRQCCWANCLSHAQRQAVVEARIRISTVSWPFVWFRFPGVTWNPFFEAVMERGRGVKWAHHQPQGFSFEALLRVTDVM